MFTRLFILLLFALPGICPPPLVAQKEIALDTSFLAVADRLEVKLGTQWPGKVFRTKFGDYEIVQSRKGAASQQSRSNFWGSRVNSATHETFRFVLADRQHGDSANVHAVNNVEASEITDKEIIKGLSIESSVQRSATKTFTASITPGRDTSDTWALAIVLNSNLHQGQSGYAVLRNGSREIVLSRASSAAPDGKQQQLPARGFYFRENGQQIAAMQYLGSGMLGMNRFIVWLHKSLDAKTRLLLASACAAIVQIKAANPDG